MAIGMGWLVGMTLAHAGVVPATREVLGISSETTCDTMPEGLVPRVVRTSAGVMVSLGDGTYAFGCPSAWGGGDARVATDVTASELWYVASGKVLSSRNGGCTLDAVDLPDGLAAVDLIYWREAFWVLAAADNGAEAGALLKWDGAAFLRLVTWESDFRPTAMMAAPGNILWVTSMAPRARVRRLDFTGGIGGDASLPNLPESIDGLTRFEPVAADEDEAWFVLEKTGKQWTWHSEFINGTDEDVVLFTDMPERKRLILGPVRVKESWIGVIDNELHTSDQLTGLWNPTGITVPWTCLEQEGERVLACTVNTIVSVDSFEEDGTPVTTDVFSLAQVAEPDGACSTATCDREFTDFLTGAGLITRADVAICPDGTTATDQDPEACACATGASPAGAWTGVGAVLWALGRRRAARRADPS